MVPMTMPAIAAPEISVVEPGSLLVEEDVELAELVVAEVVLEFPPEASGVRFAYAAQSGLGSASGQSWARQREHSWPSICGPHRLLYLAFMKVSMAWASSSEKPNTWLAIVNCSMKYPISVWLRSMYLWIYATETAPLSAVEVRGNCDA